MQKMGENVSNTSFRIVLFIKGVLTIKQVVKFRDFRNLLGNTGKWEVMEKQPIYFVV